MKKLDIAELSKQTGMPASTLRYYEEKGLITSVGRHGLRRLYDLDVFERLSLIALGRQAGFSLKEIAGILGNEERPVIDRPLLLAKADELERKIDMLAAMRDGLRHTARCSAPHHLDCPKFQKMLKVAARKQKITRSGKVV